MKKNKPEQDELTQFTVLQLKQSLSVRWHLESALRSSQRNLN